jgi:hypothetical protein
MKNTGSMKAAAVPQSYVGPASQVPSCVQQPGVSCVGSGEFASEQVRQHHLRRALVPVGHSAPGLVRGPDTRTFWVGEGLGDRRLDGAEPPW